MNIKQLTPEEEEWRDECRKEAEELNSVSLKEKMIKMICEDYNSVETVVIVDEIIKLFIDELPEVIDEEHVGNLEDDFMHGDAIGYNRCIEEIIDKLNK